MSKKERKSNKVIAFWRRLLLFLYRHKLEQYSFIFRSMYAYICVYFNVIRRPVALYISFLPLSEEEKREKENKDFLLSRETGAVAHSFFFVVEAYFQLYQEKKSVACSYYYYYIG